MSELHFPWLETAIGTLFLGAIWISQISRAEIARQRCLIILVIAFVMTLGAAIDFSLQPEAVAQSSVSQSLGTGLLVVDNLNAPLLPLTALLYLLTALATLRTKVRRYSFAWSLVGEALVLGAFACRDPWAIVLLLSLGTIRPWVELRGRQQSSRMYSVYMLTFVLLLGIGQWLINSSSEGSHLLFIGSLLVMLAVFIRSGIAPFHSWVPDLFQRATFGTALLFLAPMPGVYAATRLLLPIAPESALQVMVVASLLSAFYCAGMALIQTEARQFFGYLFLSHSALVLVGLDLATSTGLTGSLSLWLSVGMALGGFGLTLRSIEARIGRVSLKEYRGMAEQTPTLAAFFLLTGLASIGFPGTIGFVGSELIVESVIQASPLAAIPVVIVMAMNGIGVLMVYFKIFTGKRNSASSLLRMRPQERIAVLVLTLLILGGGLFPQPGLNSRHHAAEEILSARENHVAVMQATAE